MSETLSREDANKLLNESLKIASEAMEKCEAIAEEHGLSFSSPIGAYGMGGWYTSKKEMRVDAEDRLQWKYRNKPEEIEKMKSDGSWESAIDAQIENIIDDQGGSCWRSSSSSC